MITFLFVLVLVLKIVLILAVAGIAAVATDQIWSVIANGLKARRTQGGRHTKILIADMQYKENIRRLKEKVANEGFFEESYAWTRNRKGVWEYKPIKIPTPEAVHYFREMDQLVDDQIFQNTEEL